MSDGADPMLTGNVIKNHTSGWFYGDGGAGVWVLFSSLGLATIAPDNKFKANGHGNIVRSQRAEDDPDYDRFCDSLYGGSDDGSEDFDDDL